MFSGIVEATSKITQFFPRGDVFQLELQRPSLFTDIQLGDSVAVNGVCLTVEAFEDESLQFAVGPETLKVLGGALMFKVGCFVNLERSLRFGDRVHGHLVSGHVEGLGVVAAVQDLNESRFLDIQLPLGIEAFIWKKGSVAINGVSLTINDVSMSTKGENVRKSLGVSVCLIPETLKRTNLGLLKVGDSVCIEPDFLVRGLLRAKELQYEHN